MILTRAALEALIEQAVAAAPGVAGAFNACKVMLFTNAIVPNVDTLLADLTEAAFTGYARSSAVTWAVGGAVQSSDVDTPVILGDNKVFTCTGSAVEETVRGYALVDEATTPDTLLAVKVLDQDENMSNGETIVVSPRLNIRSDNPTPAGDVVLT